MVVLIC